MEISCKGHVKEIVAAAWFSGVPVAEIWLNGEKLYPLDGDVATDVLVDVAPLDIEIGGEWIYWVHALDWREKMPGCEEDDIIYGEWGEVVVRYSEAQAEEAAARLRELGYDTRVEKGEDGRWYITTRTMTHTTKRRNQLFELVIGDKVYKEGEDFTFNPNTGLVEFMGGQYPSLSSLPPGTKLKFRASVPQRDLEDRTNTSEKLTKTYDLPLLPDTKFYYLYLKGQKKVSAGMELLVEGSPSGEEFYYGTGRQNGHKRKWVEGMAPPGGPGPDNVEWKGTNKWTRGDTGFTMTEIPFNGATPQAWPVFPAFEKEWDLSVVGVVIKQV